MCVIIINSLATDRYMKGIQSHLIYTSLKNIVSTIKPVAVDIVKLRLLVHLGL